MRTFALLGSLALLTLTAVGTMPDAKAQYGPYCPSGYLFNQTPPNWGKGATCAEAEADLRARAAADIYCPDYGDCQRQLVITGACWQISSNPDMFQVDGHYRYKCLICPTCP